MHVRYLVKMNDMDSRKPVRNLVESIHSLLGFKAHLTSAWVSSVCSIIRNLPSETAPASHSQRVAKKDFEDLSSVENGVDSNTDVTGTKDELAQLLSFLNQLNEQRRQLPTEFLDLKGNIRVFCRIRPKLMSRDFHKPSPVMVLNSNDLLLQLSASKSKHYSFDKVFQQNSSQDEVFSDIEPIIKSVVDGFNACIFAYGQTGSGKTYTMEGTPESLGVVQRGIEALFKQATVSNQELKITFSMLEIYLGHLKDLLVPHSSRVSDSVLPCLSVQSDPKGGIEIDNLTSVQVSSSEQAVKLYTLGCQLRSTASTNLNKTSSRSHCMIRIKINVINALERRRETSKLWTVDLGGSERMLKTKTQGRRFEEGKAINLSLSALGDVVDALQRKRCHIPYRNSKLTLVLQDCLGEDSKTLMLVHVSPEEEDLCESVCSLNFASRARSIRLDNKESQDAKERKKAAMISLQQKMEHIENERQGIKRKVEKINKTFESLAHASDLPSTQLAGDSQLFMVAFKSDANGIDKIRNTGKFQSLELPRFMQPTVCSTRKSWGELTFYDDKLIYPRRRRPISNRVNSVSFPLKGYAAHGSDLSTSSVVDLNMISNVDNEMECSQYTSECDAQTTEFQIQGKTSKFLANQIVRRNHIPTITDNYRRRKWDSRWLIQERYVKVREQKQKYELPLPGQKARSFELPLNHNDTDNEAEGQLNIMLCMESAKSFAINRTDVLCHSTEGETWIEHQHSENGFPKVDIDCSTRGLPEFLSECTTASDLLGRGESVPAIYNGTKHSMIHTVDQLIHTPDSQYEKYADFSEPFDDSLSNMGVQIQKTYYDGNAITKNSISESMDASFQGLLKVTTQYGHRSQSHRALFTDLPEKIKENKANVNINTPIVHSRVFPQCTGLVISIKLKIQMMYFCALMWLGLQNLGYEEEFFHSLTY